MVFPSGEVETCPSAGPSCPGFTGSGWFFHPGKLKLVGLAAFGHDRDASSGWFFHPGKLKPGGEVGAPDEEAEVPDGSAIRGS